MSKKYNQTISTETQTEAMKIARANQKPGQTKEQTKLIAQGIEKGIAQYKKQQKIKAREQDKRRKQELKQTKQEEAGELLQENNNTSFAFLLLPWVLLALTWAGMAAYVLVWQGN